MYGQSFPQSLLIPSPPAAVVSPKPLRDQSAASYGAFYRRVFEFVCVASRLDIALEDESAAEEVKAAIESVLPLSGVAKFLTLSTAERSTQVSPTLLSGCQRLSQTGW